MSTPEERAKDAARKRLDRAKKREIKAAIERHAMAQHTALIQKHEGDVAKTTDGVIALLCQQLQDVENIAPIGARLVIDKARATAAVAAVVLKALEHSKAQGRAEAMAKLARGRISQ